MTAVSFPLKENLPAAMVDRVISGMASKMRNRYEAATPVSASRPYLPAYVRDARFDANSFTRWELTRKVRYFFRNTWLLPRLAEEDVKYSVGPHGLHVTPASSNPEWNKAMAEAFSEWCEAPFRDSSLPMSLGHRLLWRETHMDGEVFANCTSLKWRGQSSKPAIELIESHRCSSPGYDYAGGFAQAQGENIVDGVQFGLDERGKTIGRPSHFYIRDGIEGDEWKAIRAFNPQRPGDGGIIHVYDPERIGMPRAVTGYAPILNQTADLELLAILEMDRAKANAEDAKIFETWNGEIPASMTSGQQNFLTSRGGPSIPATSVDEDLNKRISQMRTILGGRMVALRNGEKMTYPENPSPSAAQQWLWKLVISQICTARNIPVMLVLPDSIQGTVARAVLDDAHLSFQSKFGIAARAAKYFYRYFADWARYNIPALADAPADWAACHVTPPRACNVDIGKNSAANLAEIAAGTKSYDDVASADGTTAESRFRRKAINIATAKQIAAEISKAMGVSVRPEEIIEPLGEVLVNLAKAEVLAHGHYEEVPGEAGRTGKTVEEEEEIEAP